VLQLNRVRLSEKLSRCMATAWVPQVEGVWVPRTHAVTWRNEAVSLLKRSLGPTPGFEDNAAVLAGFALLRCLARNWGGGRWSLSETALSYRGSMRRRYLEAESSLLSDPVGPGDAFLRGFLKAEKWKPDKLSKPRMIFPRDPRYNLEVASRLKPFEHWLWGRLRGFCSRGVKPSRDCAKGLGPEQRANLIRRKMSQIPGCVVFEVDGKAFEAHVTRWQLEQEHSVYVSAFPGDRGLQRLLSWQLSNRGVTSCGVRFEREGGRASGDFNTGMGNSLVMMSVVRAVLRRLTPVFDSLTDGDNSLVFLPPAVVPLVFESFHNEAVRLSGHEMTLERPTSVLEEVRFGQSAPLNLGDGSYRMVRSWDKVLSQGTSSHIWLREPSFAREWLRGVGTCEAFLGSGVPIVWAWSNAVLRCSGHSGPVRVHPFGDYAFLGADLAVLPVGREAAEPTAECRLSFQRAFGVPVDAQLEIERVLHRGFVLNIPPARECSETGLCDVWYGDLAWSSGVE